MNRNKALEHMLQGDIVQAVEPLYLRHEPGPLFCYCFKEQCVMWIKYPTEEELKTVWYECPQDRWKRCIRAFWNLSSEFKIHAPSKF